MSSKIGWFEIATKDLERAKAFYAKVLKTSFQRVEVGESALEMFNSAEGEPGISGTLVLDKDNTPSAEGTMIYFNCNDVSEEAARVNDAGGQLVLPKTDIGDFGFIAMFIDTEGNRLGLHSSK